MASEPATRAARGRGRPPASADGEDSRTRLLDAAASIFAAKGYRSATVEEVVSAAGLSKGTFYWNFKSKEDLFQTLLEERIDRPARALMEITRTAPADRPTAPDVSAGLAELIAGQRETLLLLQEYWAAATRDARLARRYRVRQAALREALAETLEERHRDDRRPARVPGRGPRDRVHRPRRGTRLRGPGRPRLGRPRPVRRDPLARLRRPRGQGQAADGRLRLPDVR